MSKYQYSKLVMEKYLRRSFYDAVLELYETAQGTRIISVSLEGNLSLVVNKDENFTIKLNEIAQRADDREEHQQRFKTISDMKVETGVDRYVVKKEDFLPNTSSHRSEVINLDGISKDNEKFGLDTGVDPGKMYFQDQKYKFPEVIEEKLNDSKTENDLFEKSSDGESETDDEADSDMGMSFQRHSFTLGESQQVTPSKIELDSTGGDDICFLPVGQIDELKKKYEYREQEQIELPGKKSPRKKLKLSAGEVDEEGCKVEDRDRTGMPCTSSDDVGGPQLLPHTATGPIIVDEDDSSYNGGMSESQMAQLAVFQMRDPGVGMFRQQELEELARQQQQWQMVAYQRSIMEKSYLQQQMQQYQRDTERLRWEYAAQQRELVQTRDYTQHTEEADKIYRQSQNSASEAAMLAAAALEQAKKCSREGSDDTGINADKLSSQHMRLLAEEHVVNQLAAEYEEGELRPDSCVLCGMKYMTLEHLMRHMEKHRVDFERSCSVCQSGTLTGNMLLLHMEASHGPETNFPLPPSAPSIPNPVASSSATSGIADFPQSFPASLQDDYGVQVQDESTGMKLPQQPQSPKHVIYKPAEAEEIASSSNVKSESNMKSESNESFEYDLAASTSKIEDDDDELSDLPQDNFLGMPSQFYPLIGCQVCGEKFALSEALDQHVESQHKDTCCTYSCKPCCLSFETHVEYSKHLARHESSSTNLKCSHCLKSFKSVKQLRLHYVAAHSCCHFCEYCRAGFPDAMSLQMHEQLHTLDPEKLTFRCDICSKAFYTQSQCSAHKRTHKDEKAHACDVCGSAFFKRGDLTKHVRTVHSPSRLFSCKFCGKKGTRMDNMRSHVRSHHKNMTRDQIISMIELIE